MILLHSVFQIGILTFKGSHLSNSLHGAFKEKEMDRIIGSWFFGLDIMACCTLREMVSFVHYSDLKKISDGMFIARAILKSCTKYFLVFYPKKCLGATARAVLIEHACMPICY